MNAAAAGEPRVDVTCLGPEIALAVARVATDPLAHPTIASHWLAGAEHARAARFAVDHGRADFLAGRIAAKSAAHALVPDAPAPAHWGIVAGEFEQPLLGATFPGRAVTIAHAGGLGLGLVHAQRWRFGIDLEPVDRDASDVIATQVAESEAAWARAAGEPAAQRPRWLLLWTAREAQGKSFGTGLLEPERLRPTLGWTPAPHGWRARLSGDDAMQVRSVVVGGWIVSLVLPAEIDADAIATWLAGALRG